MDYSIHEYSSDGLSNIFHFSADYLFATDVLDFVADLPDGGRWFLYRAQRINEDTFVVTFRTNDYLSPDYPDDLLRIKVIRPGNYTDDFTISLF